MLYGHKIIVFGGGNGANALNDVHALDVSDLSHLEWTKLATQGREPIARGYHSMNLVGSKCIVYGGSDGQECFSDIYILDLGASLSLLVLARGLTGARRNARLVRGEDGG